MPTDAGAPGTSRPEKHKHTRSQALSPSTFTQSLPDVQVNGRSTTTMTAAVEDEVQRAKRMERLADLDQTVERDSEDIVEDLLRASKKGTSSPVIRVRQCRGAQSLIAVQSIRLASYDIEKEGEVVAVLTLVKSAYRLGETISGVVTFNEPSCTRRVLRVRLLPRAPAVWSSGWRS